MAIEHSHGSARPTLPRSRDLPVTAAPPVRRQGRRADGRFAPGHGLSYSRAWETRLQAQLGTEMAGEAGELGREAWHWYRGFLAELPCVTVSVRSLVAQRARAAVLAARYARRASELGLDSEDGLRAASEAARWDQRAERLAVTAWDLSTRAAAQASRQAIDVHAEVARAFGGEGDR